MKFVLIRSALVVLLLAISTSLYASLPAKGKTALPSLERGFYLHDPQKNISKGHHLNATHIIPELQKSMETFMRTRGNPVSAVILVDILTGNILTLAQGKNPAKWGANVHTAIHNKFPAASLFKTVVASAAIEIAGVDIKAKSSLVGGCSKVRASGRWMQTKIRGKQYQIDLKGAYGKSCNGYFAKLALNETGMGPIIDYANRFRWGKPILADFKTLKSPIDIPTPETSSVHTVGRFAAGFGNVRSSLVHSAWRTLVIGANGQSRPLKLFKKTISSTSPHQVITPETADAIKKIMKATIRGGTASSAFSRGKYRILRNRMGGKTGTLTGKNPSGVTTWFAGLYPIDAPQVAVVALTVINDLWIFKAPNLAAEATYQWTRYQKKQLRSAKLKENQTLKGSNPL